MTHIKDETIAALIDGTISHEKREHVINHLEQCNQCRTIYAESLEFLEQMDAGREMIALPLKENKIYRIFTGHKIPAAASLLILLFTSYLIVNQLNRKELVHKQIALIKQNINHIGEAYGFSPSGNKTKAAVRAGILSEDMSILDKVSGEETTKARIGKMLNNYLKTLTGGKVLTKDELTTLKSGQWETTLQRIRQVMKGHALLPLFQLGRFLESGYLSTLDNQLPRQEDIKTYLDIADKHQLPKGVGNKLKKITPATDAEACREFLHKIKEIFIDIKGE